MPILFLSPRYTHDSINLKKAAEARGWSVLRLHEWKVPTDWPREEFVLYGEPLLAAVAAQSLGYTLPVPPLNWLATLPEELLNRQVRCLTAEQARQVNERAFFKPAGEKSFPAGVLDSGSQLPDHLPPDEVLLVSEIVVWTVEFRCFIRDRRCLTLSVYARHGVRSDQETSEFLATDEEIAGAEQFIARLLGDDRVSVFSPVVIDIGWIEGRGWSVIEANEAFASGLYGCDPNAVLEVLRTTLAT